ncbi:MAG: hypothetical protein IMZ54_13610 [Acidobacteria bacterium]|nr:hypothetical protein [Acidobacteriota bacterium]MBE3125295.1 hypothetical protein [Acidobacteriota bacterium]MBE3131733.1 hypothetical protein [Acidobacteriota bacterium]
MPKKARNRGWVIALTLAFWALAAWLLYPLINLDRVDMSNVKPYLYRSALGLTLLIIFFGKTLFDLIYPWVYSKKLPRLNAALLILYMIGLSGGIVFMILRMAALAMKNRSGGFPF